MKKPFNVLSTATLAAVFAGSALVPVAAAETPAAQNTVAKYVIVKDGKNLEVTKELFDAALAEGFVAAKDVKYVTDGKGNHYTLDMFNAALAESENSNFEEALEILEDANAKEDIDVEEGKFEDGELVPTEPTEDDFKVESIAAINETSVTVEFPSDSGIQEDDLKGKTISLKAGDQTLTATYAEGSFANNSAVFELAEDEVLVDAETYTVTADWATISETTFVAEIGTAYAKTFKAVTTDVYEGTSATVFVEAKDQYGEVINVPNGVSLEGSTLNGMPLLNDININNGEIIVTRDVKENDKLVIKLTNEIDDKVVGEETFEYTVLEKDDNATAPTSIAKITAEVDGKETTKFAATDEVTLSADVRDKANNPATTQGSDEVRWVVKEGKELLEKEASTYELGSDKSTNDLKIGDTPKLKIKSPGTIIVEAYNIANGAKATYTINAGAQELNALTVSVGDTIGNNKEGILLGKVEPNSGAALTASDLKFRVTDNKGNADISVPVEARVAEKDDDTGFAEGTIYIVATTEEAGSYTVVPYVGTSFDDEDTVKASPITFSTALNDTAVSIDAITLPTVKVGTPVSTDLVVKNKHGENIVSELDLNSVVEYEVYQDGGKVNKDKVDVSYDYDDKTKTAKAKFTAKDEGTYTVRLAVQDTSATTDVVVKAEETKVSSINLGADIYNIISGDEDVYRVVTVKDNKGDVILPKIGSLDGEIDIDGSVENVSLEYVEKDAKGNWTTTDEAGAEAVALKFAKGIAETSEPKTVTVKATVGDKTITDSLKVSVKATRALDQVTVDNSSLTLGLNGKSTVTVYTVDQYGDAYTATAGELSNLKLVDDNGVVKVNTDSGTQATEVKNDVEKVIGYKFAVEGQSVGSTQLHVKSDNETKATVNATVAEASDVVSSAYFTGDDFNEDGTYKYKVKADNANSSEIELFNVEGKDASGGKVSIDQSKVTWTTSDSSLLAVENGKLVVKKAVEEDTDVTVTADIYGKKATVTLTLSADDAKLDPETLEVENADKLDSDKDKEGIQIALDGDDKDGEQDGTIEVTYAGLDQYGDDITDISSVLSYKESVATVGEPIGTTIKITAAGKGETQIRTIIDGTEHFLDVIVSDEAVGSASYAEQVAAAESAAAALLNEDKDALAADVDQDAIDAAQALVDALEDEDQTTAQADIDAAQNLLND